MKLQWLSCSNVVLTIYTYGYIYGKVQNVFYSLPRDSHRAKSKIFIAFCIYGNYMTTFRFVSLLKISAIINILWKYLRENMSPIDVLDIDGWLVSARKLLQFSVDTSHHTDHPNGFEGNLSLKACTGTVCISSWKYADTTQAAISGLLKLSQDQICW